MRRHLSKLLTIKGKLFILAFIGILGMSLIAGMNWYLDGSIRKDLALERTSQTVAGRIQDILLIEEKFISTSNQELLDIYTSKKDELEKNLIELGKQSSDANMTEMIGQVADSVWMHTALFDEIVDTITGLNQDKADLNTMIQGITVDLSTIVEAIEDEEAELIMTGDLLDPIKIGLRSELKDYMSTWDRKLIAFQDLLLFGDTEKFEGISGDLSNLQELKQGNFQVALKSVNSKMFNDIWTKSKHPLEKIKDLESSTYADWKDTREQAEYLRVTADETHALVDEILKVTKENIAASQRQSSQVGMFTALGGIILLLVISVLIASAITRPIREASDMAAAIAKGDLSRRVAGSSRDIIGQLTASMNTMADSLEGKAKLAGRIAEGDLAQDVVLASDMDVLGLSLSRMVEGLNEVIGEVNKAVELTASGAAQVSDSSEAVSQGAAEQAASLEQITSSMTEMAAQTGQNADNASQANKLTLSARQAAEKGNDQMKAMIAAVKDINESSVEIARIIKTIDEIAFQTNLLALNAAVEAARAGKHGKGFAVVAQEVRNLASRSAKAAQETAELIESSVKKAENSMDIVTRTEAALKDIVTESTKAADLVGEIAMASNEQAEGISQVNQGLGQVETITQQNTTNAEQTAAAAKELSNQASQLRRLLSGFHLKNGNWAEAEYDEYPTIRATMHQLPDPASSDDYSDSKEVDESSWSADEVELWEIPRKYLHS